MLSWEGKSQNSIHLHGHLHGTPTGLVGRVKDVGMDTNDLRPYDLEAIVDQLKSLPLEVLDHHQRSVG